MAVLKRWVIGIGSWKDSSGGGVETELKRLVSILIVRASELISTDLVVACIEVDEVLRRCGIILGELLLVRQLSVSRNTGIVLISLGSKAESGVLRTWSDLTEQTGTTCGRKQSRLVGQ